MRIAFYLLASISLLVGVFGAFAMTEVGQLVNMPRSWVFGFFDYRSLISILLIGATIAVLVFNMQLKLHSKKIAGLYGVAIVGCLFAINYFAPEVWLRAQHHSAQFISVEEADKRLDENADVFVLEIDGDARAYPRDWMQLPHIVGDTVGGEDTVMTYCALSNLPMAFDPHINGQDTNFRVIAQVNNNLIFTDRNSGELIQQITGTAEYSQTELAQYPVQRMPWYAFKNLYPNGQVFDYRPNWFDKLTLKLFDSALPSHYEGHPMFPTLRLDDDRLSTGEQIWGVVVEDHALAVTTNAFLREPIIQTSVGRQPVLLKYFAELNTVAAFKLPADHDLAQLIDVDAYGNSVLGKLERENLYSGVPWMIWSHWFPLTKVMS